MESASAIQEIHIYRCRACMKLICYELAMEKIRANKREGICKCGSRFVIGTSPSNFLEDIICLGWQIRFAWRNFRGNRNVSNR